MSSVFDQLMQFGPTDQKLFTRHDMGVAHGEGWKVGWRGSIVCVSDTVFWTDQEAEKWVREQADAGSDMHKRALAFAAKFKIVH